MLNFMMYVFSVVLPQILSTLVHFERCSSNMSDSNGVLHGWSMVDEDAFSVSSPTSSSTAGSLPPLVSSSTVGSQPPLFDCQCHRLHLLQDKMPLNEPCEAWDFGGGDECEPDNAVDGCRELIVVIFG